MILCPTSKCSPSRTWTGKIRTQFMNSWRAGALLWGRNSRLPTSSIMSPTTKMTLGGQPQSLFSMKNTLSIFSPGGILKSSSWTMRVSLFVAMMNPSILQSLWVLFFTDDHILSKSKQVLLTPFLPAGSRHRRFIGQVRARPCILDPHPPILTPILRIQVWKSLPWSGHNDPSGLKLCCPVGDCVLTLWLLCIRVAVSQCCWMEETQ